MVQAIVEEAIKNNKVTIFSKSYCPYCKKTKALFAGMPEVSEKVFELDQMENGAAIQQYLLQKTGQRTVPSVFVNGQHVGGNDDTHAAAQSGKLAQMLAEN